MNIIRTSTGLASYVFKSGFGVPTHTVLRPISSVAFQNSTVYKNQPSTKQIAMDEVTEYARKTGMDGQGAERAEIAGPYHVNPPGTPEHLTVVMFDATGQQIYWYERKKRNFWDRVHVPKSRGDPAWRFEYVKVSEADFKSETVPT